MELETLLAMLPQTAVGMKREIEEFLHQPICIKMLDTDDFAGMCSIDEQGQPSISVSMSLDASVALSTLVHELFHLQLRIDGYPSGFFVGSKTPNPNRSWQDFLINCTEEIKEITAHSLFFSKMREMALDTDSLESDFYRTSIDNGSFRTCQEWEQSLHFARAQLELSDQNLVSELAGCLQDHSRNIGLSIAEVIRTASIKSPKEYAITICTALSVLLRPFGVSASFLDWQIQPRGAYFQDQVGVVLIEPFT